MSGTRVRVLLCFPKAGQPYKAHFYGTGARPSSGRLTCVRCGDTSSERVNLRNAKWMRQRRKRFMAEGRCYQCGKPPLFKVDLCARCYGVRLQRQRERRRDAKTDRACYICGRSCEAGHSSCAQCRKDRREKNRQLARGGVCPNCRKPNDRRGLVYCTECAAKRNAILRRAYHEGRIKVRDKPRGKQKPWFPKREHERTPIAASVYLPAAGSIARSLASLPLHRRDDEAGK